MTQAEIDKEIQQRLNRKELDLLMPQLEDLRRQQNKIDRLVRITQDRINQLMQTLL